MKDKRPFLQWFVITVAYVVAAFFAYQFGVFHKVWNVDFTYMTSLIALTFISSQLYLGYATWKYDPNNTTQAYASVGVGRVAAFIVTLMGLLGTALGLMALANAIGGVDVANPSSILQSLKTELLSLSTALYATCTGIIACMGLTATNTNLEYFADRDDK